MARNRREYHTVILSGLLHDVGKFLQRGEFGRLTPGGKHPQVSADFVSAFADRFDRVVDADLLRTLVQRHHEGPSFPPELRVQEIADPHIRALAFLVSRADNFSSSERGERAGRWRDFRSVRLASIFGRLQIEGATVPSLLYLKAHPLGRVEELDVIFGTSTDQHAAGDINRLLAEFGAEWQQLVANLDWDDFDCVSTHLQALLQKYTWSLPSDTQEATPDVSLFDHFKTVAAIAACLYQYHAETGSLQSEAITRCSTARFRLLVGDLSGIQDYVYGIAASGAARRLRARSLFVQLVSEVASHVLLRRLDLPLCNLLMASGGKFYLLLPNLPAAVETQHAVQAEVDRWLMTELNGELALNLASVEFDDAGFGVAASVGEGFGGVLERLAGALAIRKGRRFAEVLQVDGAWDEAAFVRSTDFSGRGVCRSCGHFPIVHDDLCIHCRRDTELGARLPSARFLAFFAGPDGQIPIVGASVSAIDNLGEIGRGRPYLVARLNDAELGTVRQLPASFRYLAIHVPRTCDGVALQFTELAERAGGARLLAFLKADVDRLGEAFTFGFKREAPGPSLDTISRLTTLGRSLDLFFSGWVENLLRGAYQECYSVFAGGDDLFVVGPWQQAVEFAGRLRADFQRFTGHPGLTLSAGLAVAKPRYPIGRAASAAAEAVEEAKRAGRDRVALLGLIARWEELLAAWSEAQNLIADWPASKFLYTLRDYGAMWRRYRQNGDTLGLRSQPLLAYAIARNVDPRSQPRLDVWTRSLVGLRPGDRGQLAALDQLELLAGLAILGVRGGK